MDLADGVKIPRSLSRSIQLLTNRDLFKQSIAFITATELYSKIVIEGLNNKFLNKFMLRKKTLIIGRHRKSIIILSSSPH